MVMDIRSVCMREIEELTYEVSSQLIKNGTTLEFDTPWHARNWKEKPLKIEFSSSFLNSTHTHRQSMKTKNFSKLRESFRCTFKSRASHIKRQNRAHALRGMETKLKPLTVCHIHMRSYVRIQWFRTPLMALLVSFYGRAPMIHFNRVHMHSKSFYKVNNTLSRMRMDEWKCSRRRRKFPFQCKWQDCE